MGKPMKSLWVLLFASTGALADDAAWLRCRAIVDAPSRLACYDAVMLPAAGTAKPEPVDLRRGASSSEPRLAAEQFGLETRSRGPVLDEVESRIPGRFEGWRPKSVIKLSNGQVWQVSDDSNGFYRLDNPKVKIRRGMLGAFFLEIEGVNRSPKVRRLE